MAVILIPRWQAQRRIFAFDHQATCGILDLQQICGHPSLGDERCHVWSAKKSRRTCGSLAFSALPFSLPSRSDQLTTSVFLTKQGSTRGRILHKSLEIFEQKSWKRKRLERAWKRRIIKGLKETPYKIWLREVNCKAPCVRSSLNSVSKCALSTSRSRAELFFSLDLKHKTLRPRSIRSGWWKVCQIRYRGMRITQYKSSWNSQSFPGKTKIFWEI